MGSEETGHARIISTTLIRSRQADDIPTYTCFVDFAKTVDTINHELLWHTVYKFKTQGKIYKVVKYVYSQLYASVNLEGTYQIGSKVESGSGTIWC